jgi:Tfp pilus assembly protein PilO
MAISIRLLDRVCLAGVILAVCAAGAWSFTGHMAKKKAVQREKSLITSAVKELNLAENHAMEFQKSLEAAKKRLTALHDKIPENADMGRFIKELDFMMKNSRLGLISVSPLPATQENVFIKVPVRLSFKGPFENVCRLLLDLESMKRAVLMENLDIRKTGSEGECLVNVTASIFEQPKQKV